MYPESEDDSFDLLVNEEAASLIYASRQGLAFDFFTKILIHLPIKFAEWSKYLHLSDRTMQRYKKENKHFEALYAEKILEIALLYQNGKSVFGSQQVFDRWMDSENIALGGSKPKSLLDSNFGIQLIKDVLIRIEHGVVS
jgi:putative toxin-antitoxin system antitoxin component (TIGR02293 family)